MPFYNITPFEQILQLFCLSLQLSYNDWDYGPNIFRRHIRYLNFKHQLHVAGAAKTESSKNYMLFISNRLKFQCEILQIRVTFLSTFNC